MVIRLSGTEKFDFEICPEIPFIKEYAVCENDNCGRSGKVSVRDGRIILEGKMEYYNISYEAQVKVITDARVDYKESSICAEGATEAVILIGVGTDYKLCKEVFLSDDRLKKTLGEHPHKRVTEYIDSASKKSYAELLNRHTEDFSLYMGRVSLDLGEDDAGETTEELLLGYKNGKRSKYLETLYFRYGRYLLISSSRPGCLPANLQGIWNCHECAPWGSGYCHI